MNSSKNTRLGKYVKKGADYILEYYYNSYGQKHGKYTYMKNNKLQYQLNYKNDRLDGE